MAAPPSAGARANPASRILERVQDNLLGTLTPEERRQFVGLLARVLDGQGDRG